MRIAYVGNFEPRHSTENHLRLTLESMGHTVLPLQENRLHCDAIFEQARNCDLFLYTRTWGFLDGMKAGRILLDRLAAAGVPTASYHLDLYFGLQRQRGMEGDPFWRTRYVFTPDGGHAAEFAAAGINHHYVKPGVYGPECVRGTPRPEFAYDVVFVGSYANYHPEWPYRRRLVDWLRATYGPRFAHFGDANVVRNEALNDLYASAKVVVGDTLCPGFNHPHYWSDRAYETVGRGGFLIHPYIRGMEDEFRDREHLVYYQFGKFDQLRSLIDYYVDHDEEREAIRERGQAFVREHATYAHRLERALEIIRAAEAAAGRRKTATNAPASLKLEIGSGYAPHPEFDVHMDANPRCPHLEHVGSADRLPWADGTFAAVRACDVLEHFSYRDTARVLSEWRRVLAPGGRIYVQVPDARRIAKAWLDGSLRRSEHVPADAPADVHAAYWLLGGQGGDDFSRPGDDWRLNAHYTLFSPESLRHFMERAGFTDIATEPLGYNIACHARRS